MKSVTLINGKEKETELDLGTGYDWPFSNTEFTSLETSRKQGWDDCRKDFWNC